MYDVRSRVIWDRRSASFELDLQAASRASGSSYYGWRTRRTGLQGFLDRLEHRTIELLERTRSLAPAPAELQMRDSLSGGSSAHVSSSALPESESAILQPEGEGNEMKAPMPVYSVESCIRCNKDLGIAADSMGEDCQEQGCPDIVEHDLHSEPEENVEFGQTSLEGETEAKCGDAELAKHCEKQGMISDQKGLEISAESDEGPLSNNQPDKDVDEKVDESSEVDSQSKDIEENHNNDPESSHDRRSGRNAVNMQPADAMEGSELHDKLEIEPVESNACAEKESNVEALIGLDMEAVDTDRAVPKSAPIDEEDKQAENGNADHQDSQETQNDLIDDLIWAKIADELKDEALETSGWSCTEYENHRELHEGGLGQADDSPPSRIRPCENRILALGPAWSDTSTGLVALRKSQFENVLFSTTDDSVRTADRMSSTLCQNHTAGTGNESRSWSPGSRSIETASLKLRPPTQPTLSDHERRENSGDLRNETEQGLTSRSAKDLEQNPSGARERQHAIPEPNISSYQSLVILFVVLAFAKAIIAMARRHWAWSGNRDI